MHGFSLIGEAISNIGKFVIRRHVYNYIGKISYFFKVLVETNAKQLNLVINCCSLSLKTQQRLSNVLHFIDLIVIEAIR